jgi:flagellar protein FlgJ
MTPYALQASQATGVSAPLMMGQAALESGWGRREIRLPDGSNSYNLFGIKATGNWNGKVAAVTTTEYQNGVPHKQVEKFRAYGSYAEAFNDYANMLGNNPRYAAVVQNGQGASGAAQALQRAGYATDPNYADKLVKVMGRINTLGG